MKHAARLALAFLFLLPAGTTFAQEVFLHAGWKGYVVPDYEMGGCRMSKRAGSIHAVMHLTERGSYLVGFVDPRATMEIGYRVTGDAWFDGSYFSLSGSVDNPKLVTFAAEGPSSLADAFRYSSRMRLEWSGGGGWIDMGLSGSGRALDLLEACARRSVAPPLTSYAPSGEGQLLSNTDLPGNDYRRLDGMGLSQCITLCAADPACRAVTHNGNKGVCFTKYGVGRVIRFGGATSWVK